MVYNSVVFSGNFAFVRYWSYCLTDGFLALQKISLFAALFVSAVCQWHSQSFPVSFNQGARTAAPSCSSKQHLPPPPPPPPPFLASFLVYGWNMKGEKPVSISQMWHIVEAFVRNVICTGDDGWLIDLKLGILKNDMYLRAF